MANDYDYIMGLTSVGPVSFVIGAALCIFVGWLITRKK